MEVGVFVEEENTASALSGIDAVGPRVGLLLGIGIIADLFKEAFVAGDYVGIGAGTMVLHWFIMPGIRCERSAHSIANDSALRKVPSFRLW
jgi:hypothetical protein